MNDLTHRVDKELRACLELADAEEVPAIILALAQSSVIARFVTRLAEDNGVDVATTIAALSPELVAQALSTETAAVKMWLQCA